MWIGKFKSLEDIIKIKLQKENSITISKLMYEMVNKGQVNLIEVNKLSLNPEYIAEYEDLKIRIDADYFSEVIPVLSIEDVVKEEVKEEYIPIWDGTHLNYSIQYNVKDKEWYKEYYKFTCSYGLKYFDLQTVKRIVERLNKLGIKP